MCLAGAFWTGNAAAQVTVLQSFDRVFAGDDPTEGFTFTLPHDPAMPTWLRFDGFAENLAFDETGVRFALRWDRAPGELAGSLLFPEGDGYFMGVRLPGTGGTPNTTPVPLHFGALLDFAPGTVHLTVEGLGPADYFRLAGDLTLQPVPEPKVWVLALLGVALVNVMRRQWRHARN